MPIIELHTTINSDIQTVFDLSRSVDLHQISTKKTNEKAIAGKLSGLMELNDTVTWRAKHFGIYQTLTSKITEYERPRYFVDEMVSGIFKRFRHEHRFLEKDGKVTMTDVFDYTAPLGILGKMADKLFLERYMTYFLHLRNETIKTYAESNLKNELIN